MALLQHSKKILFGFISISSFIVIFYATGLLILFLSNPVNHHPKAIEIQAQNFTRFEDVLWALFVNSLIISSFILQHTLLALPIVKDFFTKIHLKPIQRSIYVLGTSVSIYVLIKFWQFIPSYILWQIDATEGVFWWLFITVHSISWALIYGGVLILDITELMGLKQVYYLILNIADPLCYKSEELQKLYSNMRHPGLLTLLAIFWIYPVMSLDRLLLSLIFSLYIIFRWTTDENDINYMYLQLIRKKASLF